MDLPAWLKPRCARRACGDYEAMWSILSAASGLRSPVCGRAGAASIARVAPAISMSASSAGWADTGGRDEGVAEAGEATQRRRRSRIL